jgi:hypothetical protein
MCVSLFLKAAWAIGFLEAMTLRTPKGGDYYLAGRLSAAALYISHMASQSPCLSPMELAEADVADVAGL